MVINIYVFEKTTLISSLVCVLVQTVVVGSKYTSVWKTVSSLSVYMCDNQCRGDIRGRKTVALRRVYLSGKKAV